MPKTQAPLFSAQTRALLRGSPGVVAVRMLDRCMDGAIRLAAPVYLRTLLGRWPDQEETAVFRWAHRNAAGLPRALAGFARIEHARRLLTSATLENWLGPEAAPAAGDALILAQRPRAAFLHLEKTGGNSVQEFLLPHYHLSQTFAQLPGSAAEMRAQLRSDDARRSALISGHYDLPQLREADPAREVFTVLREPRARILSLYYYWRAARSSAAGNDPNAAAIAAAQLPLREFLRDPRSEIRNAIDNFYTRRLTGLSVTEGADPLIDAPQAALAAAMTALDSLLLVGITERMEQTLHLLALRLCLNRPRKTPRANVSVVNERTLTEGFRPVPRETVTAEIAAELQRLTRLDDAVYAAAVARFDAACKLADFPAR